MSGKPAARDSDVRVGDLLQRQVSAATRVVLVGFPSDEGIRRNGGRVGAAAGPAALREHLLRLTPSARDEGRLEALLRRTCDLGDTEVSGDVETDQSRLAEQLAPHLEAGLVAVVLGGGHETTFGHFCAWHRAGQTVDLLNVDAHPDVRPPGAQGAHSGSPFRQVLDLEPTADYRVAGLQPASVARCHVDELERRGGRCWWVDEVDGALIAELLPSECLPKPGLAGRRLLVSMDLDAVDGAQAPGVSAPSTAGLPALLWLQVAEAAGRCERVGSFDVVELSPPLDVGGRTARLAAQTVWRFLLGLAQRLDAEGSPALDPDPDPGESR